jgi:hypothetical protein
MNYRTLHKQQTIQWLKTTDNTMVTRTNYDLQNTTQTTDNTMIKRDKL